MKTYKNQTGDEIIPAGQIPYHLIYSDYQTFGTTTCETGIPWNFECKCDENGDGITDYMASLDDMGTGGATIPNYPYPYTLQQAAVITQICCRTFADGSNSACYRSETTDTGGNGGGGGDYGPPVAPTGDDVDVIISDDEQLNPLGEALTDSDGFTPIFGGTNPRPKPIFSSPVLGSTIPRPRPRPTTIPRPKPRPQNVASRKSASRSTGSRVRGFFQSLWGGLKIR